MEQWTEEQKTRVLEYVYMAIEGFITLNELASRIELVTGGKIERYVPEIDAELGYN